MVIKTLIQILMIFNCTWTYFRYVLIIPIFFQALQHFCYPTSAICVYAFHNFLRYRGITVGCLKFYDIVKDNFFWLIVYTPLYFHNRIAGKRKHPKLFHSFKMPRCTFPCAVVHKPFFHCFVV